MRTFAMLPLIVGVATTGTTARAAAGVIWNRVDVYGGWQALWIESVTLDGQTVGMRVWF